MTRRPASEEDAREYAFLLLSYRPRTTSEVQQRLVSRGYDPQVASSVVDSLRERGYLDDRTYAEQFVDERMRNRPAGRRYLLWELARRGVDRQLARQVVDRLVTPDLEIQAARELAARQPLYDDRHRLRAYRLLLRRGFSPHLARVALDVDGQDVDA